MIQGLDKLQNLIRVLKVLPKEVRHSADIAMVNNSAEYLQLNRDQLRNNGQDSEGNQLQYKRKRVSRAVGNYTQNYNRFKSKQGGQISFVDLTLSGNFLNSLRLDHKRIGVFRIFSETAGFDLEKELMWNYGKDIFGLQDDNLQMFCDKNLSPAIEFDIEQMLNRI